MINVEYDSVENYYKRLVLDYIISQHGDAEFVRRPGTIEDIACLALNQLPPRYVRHAIDTAFYITIEEQREMIGAVKAAVNRAVDYVISHPREPLGGALPKSLAD